MFSNRRFALALTLLFYAPLAAQDVSPGPSNETTTITSVSAAQVLAFDYNGTNIHPVLLVPGVPGSIIRLNDFTTVTLFNTHNFSPSTAANNCIVNYGIDFQTNPSVTQIIQDSAVGQLIGNGGGNWFGTGNVSDVLAHGLISYAVGQGLYLNCAPLNGGTVKTLAIGSGGSGYVAMDTFILRCPGAISSGTTGQVTTATALTPGTTTGTAAQPFVFVMSVNDTQPIDGGNGPVTVTFAPGSTSAAAVVSQIIAQSDGSFTASVASGNKITISSTATGPSASLMIDMGTAEATLGIMDGEYDGQGGVATAVTMSGGGCIVANGVATNAQTGNGAGLTLNITAINQGDSTLSVKRTWFAVPLP